MLSSVNWTNFPKVPVLVEEKEGERELEKALSSGPLLPYGRGRSYNDACLSPRLLSTRRLNHFVSFDGEGLLEAQAGVSLGEVIETFLPMGFFPPVVPGTKEVSLGGAVSADVHGKNAQPVSFCSFVEELEVLLPDGGRRRVRRGEELFKGFCGGLGLLGVVLRVKLRLRRVKSAYLKVKTLKPSSLEELLTLFKREKGEFTVAWLDLLNDSYGKRSLFFSGSFSEEGLLKPVRRRSLPFPPFVPFPKKGLVKLYNALYYAKKEGERLLSYEEFFFPLDRWKNWNRFYGGEGFVQTQFIVPEKGAPSALEEVLYLLRRFKLFPFLAVLKFHEGGGEGFLSYPAKGYSLALDFPLSPSIPHLLSELEKVVLKYGGHHYLVKEAFLSRRGFWESYGERAERFKSLRKELGAEGLLESYLSMRLNL